VAPYVFLDGKTEAKEKVIIKSGGEKNASTKPKQK
jgi:hypothetical protein